jgi:hypothetical protein
VSCFPCVSFGHRSFAFVVHLSEDECRAISFQPSDYLFFLPLSALVFHYPPALRRYLQELELRDDLLFVADCEFSTPAARGR